MNAKRLAPILACLCLGLGTAAVAAPGHDGERRGPPSAQHHAERSRHAALAHRPQARPPVVVVRPAPHGRNARFDAHVRDAPPHRWAKGDVLPTRYRARQHVVHDYRRHDLRTPPRGQQWVRVGSEYLLVGLATGVILQAVLSR